MYGLAHIALALATFMSMTAAAPLEKLGSFSVTRKLNPNFVMANGPAAYAGAFQIYHKTPPHDLAVATGNDGSVTATPENQYDREYVYPVSIDGQTLRRLPPHKSSMTKTSNLCDFVRHPIS